MNATPTILKGKAWVIKDSAGAYLDNIDTDMIFHNAHLAITDIAKMGPHSFGNLQGWEDFPQKAKKGDILVVGSNFGAGSSRQQAVDCFIALGITCIVAESFGAIYKRNAINTGLPLVCKDGLTTTHAKAIETGDELEINLEKSVIKNLTQKTTIETQPFSRVQMDIYQSGGLYAYGKALEAGKA